MTKHYFVSYISFDNGTTTVGHALITATNQSLSEIAESIAKENNTESITITCLKDLSEEELNMLSGK